MPDITMLDLVQNGTLDEHVAALLWTVAEEKRWLVTAAVPRKAGKTTVLEAALQFAPPGTPIHHLDGTIEEIQRFGKNPDGGYLVVGEISTEPPARYIWGDRVRALFKSLRAGFSLATTLHAPDVDGVFDQICRGNGILDVDASRIQYVVHVERFGDSDETYRRRVAGVYEVAAVAAGKPDARPLHKWSETLGRLEQVRSPKCLTASAATLAKRARSMRRLVDAGRTSPEDIKLLVARAAAPRSS
jgi:type IV secretory pathway ATPase VirB11/archaellum biosynthesis ATPase